MLVSALCRAGLCTIHTRRGAGGRRSNIIPPRHGINRLRWGFPFAFRGPKVLNYRTWNFTSRLRHGNESLDMRYVLKQKVFSLAGAFYIKDEQEQDIFIVQGKVFSFGHQRAAKDRLGAEL